LEPVKDRSASDDCFTFSWCHAHGFAWAWGTSTANDPSTESG
jgi:hypothetical protein